ncbi:MAG: hypothetical protein AAF438_16760 [Pseudomonadota bacterium]
MRVRIILVYIFALCFGLNAYGQDDLEQGTSGDLWDVSRGTVVTDSSMVFPGSDARNMLGAELNTITSDPTGTLIFVDTEDPGFTHFVEWETVAPVTVGQLNLYANSDGVEFPQFRGLNRFTLLAENDNQEFEVVLDVPIATPYEYAVENSFLLVAATFDAVTAQRFRAEFVQVGDPVDGRSGPRVWELDGFPPAAGVSFRPAEKLNDLNQNLTAEIAILRNRGTGPFNVRVTDASSGDVINSLSFLNDLWSARQLLAIEGLAQGSALAVFATRDSDRVPTMQVKLAADGTTVRNLFPWSAAWEMIEAMVVDGAAPGGGPAIATLATRNSDGLPGVELRDPSDNTRFRIIYPLGFGWTPTQMELVDINGQPAIAVLHTRDSDGLTIVQVRAVATGNLVRNVFPLGFGWSPVELKAIPDISGNGVDEVAVRMTRDTDGLEVIQIRDASTNALVSNVYAIGAGGGVWTTRQFEVIENGGQVSLGILSTRNSDGQMLLQTRDPLSAAPIKNTFFIGPPWEFNGAYQVIPDYSGNGAEEAALMVFNETTNNRLIQVRDPVTSTVLRNLNAN